MDKVSQAKARMMLKSPFFGSLLLSSELVKDYSIPTAATDMSKIYYNPDFFDTLSVEVIQFVLVHEVLHKALLHGMRKSGRVHKVWNSACDYAINLIASAEGHTLWKHCLIDNKYKGMSAEAIYDKLIQDPPPSDGSGSGEGDGGGDPFGPSSMGGDVLDPAAGDAASRRQVEQEVRNQVAQAANVARMAGAIGADLQRLIDSVIAPPLPWADMLRDYMLEVSQDDEDWGRANRRFEDLHLPTVHGERMDEFIVIPDTSGSVGQHELNQVGAIIQDVTDTLNPRRVRVLWSDTKVAGEQVFEEGDPLLFDAKGGGGTDMRVPLDYVTRYDPAFVILITDGYTPWPKVPPSYPLIVVCTTSQAVPIGHVVRLT